MKPSRSLDHRLPQFAAVLLLFRLAACKQDNETPQETGAAGTAGAAGAGGWDGRPGGTTSGGLPWNSWEGQGGGGQGGVLSGGGQSGTGGTNAAGGPNEFAPKVPCSQQSDCPATFRYCAPSDVPGSYPIAELSEVSCEAGQCAWAKVTEVAVCSSAFGEVCGGGYCVNSPGATSGGLPWGGSGGWSGGGGAAGEAGGGAAGEAGGGQNGAGQAGQSGAGSTAGAGGMS